MRRTFVAVSAAAAVASGAGIFGAATVSAQPRCTDQINYAADPRSNAEINSIGASTGQCPTPMSEQFGLPGLVSGALEGAPCYNWMSCSFGQTPNGGQVICAAQGDGAGQVGAIDSGDRRAPDRQSLRQRAAIWRAVARRCAVGV